ncbi:tol-pal system-associated acyl-CoA thioesterase [Lysobacter pythonis]|uniref:Tol-pal system-associated acyl-CoA thioesterase n=1 Tax=Solilutibacter pythonis TaxID=2483112 RepID=A0A3M2I185_9GAMM|nr:tol-pal system-associated acyl-CoA thioesterase [Lysobacter pythonis]RMH94135.1 tol-pal system-associated acyl-CoA thioesterase [Lysobacter pythonis]
MTRMPMTSQPPPENAFSFPVRVYWEDTDAGGVVYHAQYLAFMERARSEWVRALGWGQDQLSRTHDLAFVVRAMRVDFRAPAKLDDLLSVSVVPAQCRRASLVVTQEIRREGRLLLDAEVRVAAVSVADFRPRAIPEAVLARLASPAI